MFYSKQSITRMIKMLLIFLGGIVVGIGLVIKNDSSPINISFGENVNNKKFIDHNGTMFNDIKNIHNTFVTDTFVSVSQYDKNKLNVAVHKGLTDCRIHLLKLKSQVNYKLSNSVCISIE